MGSCCSCPDKEIIPDNHHNKFKVSSSRSKGVCLSHILQNNNNNHNSKKTHTQLEVHTYVNTTGLQEERRSRGGGHAPLELRTSNPESAVSPNELEPRVVLEPEGVKFVLGPTPVQRQMLTDATSPAKTVNGGTDCDTGYDSDERKETPHETHNGVPPITGSRARRNRPPVPLPDAHNANNSAQRRTALLNYENLPALPPVWETRKPNSHEEELKSPSLNGFHSLDHNYVNTENVKLHSSSTQHTVFNFDLRRLGVADPLRQLNYIEVEMDKVSDSSGPHTPKTPTTPLPPTPTRRTELYTVIDIERTAAMSSLQKKAQPRDDGTSRKTRHNSTDLPM
uniref:Fibroblast growth factor receptor substrate 2a n=1 Tax=Sinocyclocheilus anshuiensis TaxID=1608454 RepID=A0A671KCN1_9TELE